MEELISKLQENLRVNSYILDIGFGNGLLTFQLLHELHPKLIKGIESLSLEETETVEQQGGYDDFDLKGRVPRYEFYKLVAGRLHHEPYDQRMFHEKVNFLHDLSFSNYKDERTYSLVVMFKTLQSNSFQEYTNTIDKATELLNEKGLLLLGLTANTDPGNSLNVDKVQNYLKSKNYELLHTEKEAYAGAYLYLFKRS
jgi:hypothetical protein